jgi:glycosyltransferase involved in cell wall biosynthesis
MKPEVFHLIYSLYRGGAERLIESIVSGGSGDFSHTVCSITGGGDLIESLRSSGAAVIALGRSGRADIGRLSSIAGAVRAVAPAVVHMHNPPAAVWGTLSSIAGGWDIPVVRTEHRPYVPRGLPYPYRLLYGAVNRRTTAIVCVSDTVRRSLESAFPRAAPIMRTIHNGVDTSAFAASRSRERCREIFGLPPRATVVGTVGRLVPVKNQSLLMKAFGRISGRFPGARLAILGEGALRKDLASLAARERLGDLVSFHDPVREVSDFYGALDVFALSSDSEGLPLSVLEAMASGLPVAATSVGGIPEAVADGESGLLVPPGDPVPLAAALESLLENPELSGSMGERGRIVAMERFDAGDCVSAYEECYSAAIAAEH